MNIWILGKISEILGWSRNIININTEILTFIAYIPLFYSKNLQESKLFLRYVIFEKGFGTLGSENSSIYQFENLIFGI